MSCYFNTLLKILSKKGRKMKVQKRECYCRSPLWRCWPKHERMIHFWKKKRFAGCFELSTIIYTITASIWRVQAPKRFCVHFRKCQSLEIVGRLWERTISRQMGKRKERKVAAVSLDMRLSLDEAPGWTLITKLEPKREDMTLHIPLFFSFFFVFVRPKLSLIIISFLLLGRQNGWKQSTR